MANKILNAETWDVLYLEATDPQPKTGVLVKGEIGYTGVVGWDKAQQARGRGQPLLWGHPADTFPLSSVQGPEATNHCLRPGLCLNNSGRSTRGTVMGW